MPLQTGERGGNVGGRQSGGGYLIEQWLKQVIIHLVNDDDLHHGIGKVV